MKKLLIIILAAALAASPFYACGENDKSGESSVYSSSAPDEASASEESEISVEEGEEMEKEYDFSDISYDVSVTPGAPENIESCEMIISHATESIYRFTYDTEAGKMSMTFIEKDWGTFNLGSWTLTDDEGTCRFVTGSTDMEYVYRSAKKGETGYVWSGGNHGNEKLVSLELFDDITGERIEMEEGDELCCDRVRIVEKTKLHWGDPDDTYCDVIRTYRIAGQQVTLNVDYKYTNDCIHYLSYTCMFPIDKKYGLYADMIGTDGNKVATIETEKVGKADYSGPQHSGNAASGCVVYGYANERYSFDVRVNTLKDSLDDLSNEYKTSFWDMNTDTNKLYFSKYYLDTPTEIVKGTEFHTECVWRFCIDGK